MNVYSSDIQYHQFQSNGHLRHNYDILTEKVEELIRICESTFVTSQSQTDNLIKSLQATIELISNNHEPDSDYPIHVYRKLQRLVEGYRQLIKYLQSDDHEPGLNGSVTEILHGDGISPISSSSIFETPQRHQKESSEISLPRQPQQTTTTVDTNSEFDDEEDDYDDIDSELHNSLITLKPMKLNRAETPRLVPNVNTSPFKNNIPPGMISSTPTKQQMSPHSVIIPSPAYEYMKSHAVDNTFTTTDTLE